MTREQAEQMMRDKHSAYQREWRKRNPEKVRKYHENYKEKQIRKLMEQPFKEETTK